MQVGVCQDDMDLKHRLRPMCCRQRDLKRRGPSVQTNVAENNTKTAGYFLYIYVVHN